MPPSSTPVFDSSSAPRFTFGVEIEFLLPVVKRGQNDPVHNRRVPLLTDSWLEKNMPSHNRFNYDDKYAEILGSAVIDRLASGGIAAINRVSAPMIQASLDYRQDRIWTLTNECSLMIGPHEWKPELSYRSLELVSPIFNDFNVANVEIQKVCRALREHLSAFVNESCGLHIHVGRGTLGFESSMLKNIGIFLWAFDPLLMTIHPSYRRDCTWAKNIRTTTPLALSRSKPGLMGAYDGLERLIASSTGQSVIAKLGSRSEAASYGNEFENIAEPFHHSVKRTIEFRHHEGTLDAERILQYINLKLGILTYCCSVPHEQMVSLARAYCIPNAREEQTSWQQRYPQWRGSITLYQLLTTIGLRNSAVYYSSPSALNHAAS